MVEIRQTAQYSEWVSKLRDRAAVQRIAVRIRRLQEGNPGQHRVLTGGVEEMKIDFGPGYRIYYTWRGATLVILLAGGSKAGQQQDIELAQRLAKEADD
jgi:putative addiction module killer protein